MPERQAGERESKSESEGNGDIQGVFSRRNDPRPLLHPSSLPLSASFACQSWWKAVKISMR